MHCTQDCSPFDALLDALAQFRLSYSRQKGICWEQEICGHFPAIISCRPWPVTADPNVKCANDSWAFMAFCLITKKKQTKQNKARTKLPPDLRWFTRRSFSLMRRLNAEHPGKNLLKKKLHEKYRKTSKKAMLVRYYCIQHNWLLSPWPQNWDPLQMHCTSWYTNMCGKGNDDSLRATCTYPWL